MSFVKEAWQKRRTESSVGKNTLIPVLKAKGITSLDKVFVTHAHADHMGELETLAKEIRIQEIYISKGTSKKGMLKHTLEVLNRIPVIEIAKGDVVGTNEYPFEVLSPRKPSENTNNDSLVLRARLGGLIWLFTGDAEREIEQELLQEEIRADVLKAGHHGSKTSSSAAFVAKVQPSWALISCGVNNHFGHPNQETLATFEKNQVEVLRTDQNGMIVYRFFGGFQTKLK